MCAGIMSIISAPAGSLADTPAELLRGPAIESVSESAGTDPESEAYRQMRLLTETMLHVRRLYVERKDYEEIIEGALHGMLAGLDAHSDYLDEQGYEAIQDSTTSRFSGIGIHIGMRDGLPTVIAPIEDTPAFRAGLMSGDRIVEIEGESTRGTSLKDAVEKLRGPAGEPVEITVIRKDEEEPLEFRIVRDDIKVPSVKGARILDDGVGYIRITTFSKPTGASLQRAIDRLLSEGMNALVLDLRSNPGGLLLSAIEVCQKFLKEDSLIVTTKGRAGVYGTVETRSKGPSHYVDFPMAVLVNGGSASASEIVAGALQDNRRAVLVGSTTYGKGSVQSIIPLETDGKNSAIRLTTARYYTPLGRQIHGKGIEPDIPVPVSLEEWREVIAWRAREENPDHYSDEEKRKYEDVMDRQLQRSVDLVRALRIFNR